jgi:serine beta-lactamase-like protein LACTB
MQKQSRLVSFLFLVALIANGSAIQHANAASENLWMEELAAAAAAELEQTGIPSLQIAVGYQGDVVFEGAYGLADVENAVVATTETKYRTASVSKWLTATATMRLADQGLLDLDANIQTYCSQFPEKRWPITVRNLLTHTSGIRHYADYDAALTAAKSDAERDEIEGRRLRDALGEFTRYSDVIAPLDNFKDDPLVFEPGTEWLYSSFGYRVLGCVLEGVGDRSYQTVMKDEVFDQIGMTNTVVDDAWAIIPHRAAGYRLLDGELRRADMRDVSENLPAGGHLTTARDLIVFALAFESEQLISTRTAYTMSTPVFADANAASSSPSWRDAIPSKEKTGYGVMIFPTGSNSWHGHSGRQAGASSIVMQAPEGDLSIAVLTNTKGWNGYMSFTAKIRAILESSLVE